MEGEMKGLRFIPSQTTKKYEDLTSAIYKGQENGKRMQSTSFG